MILTFRLFHLVHFHAAHFTRRRAHPVVHRHPEGIGGGIIQGLLVAGAPVITHSVQIHVEIIDPGIVRVQDVKRHIRIVVRPELHIPFELSRVSVATARTPVEVVDVGHGIRIVTHGHRLNAGDIVAITVACLDPVAVDQWIVQALAIDEDPRALIRDTLHLEVVGHTIVGVVDLQRRPGRRIHAIHDSTPHVDGVISCTIVRADAQVADVELALIVEIGTFVVTGVTTAVLDAFTVVPAACVEVPDSGHGLGLHAHRPAFRIVTVDHHVQVGSRVGTAGTAFTVATVAHLPDVVVAVDIIANIHEDLGEVCVAAVEASAMIDDHGIAVALIATAVRGHLDHNAFRQRGHGLAIGVTAVPGKVQGVAVITVLEAVVRVAPGVVAACDHPVLARGEREGQVGRSTTTTEILPAGIRHDLIVAVVSVFTLMGTPRQDAQEDQNGPLV